MNYVLIERSNYRSTFKIIKRIMSKCELCEKEKDSNYFHRSRFGLFSQVAGLIQILALHDPTSRYPAARLLLDLPWIAYRLPYRAHTEPSIISTYQQIIK